MLVYVIHIYIHDIVTSCKSPFLLSKDNVAMCSSNCQVYIHVTVFVAVVFPGNGKTYSEPQQGPFTWLGKFPWQAESGFSHTSHWQCCFLVPWRCQRGRFIEPNWWLEMIWERIWCKLDHRCKFRRFETTFWKVQKLFSQWFMELMNMIWIYGSCIDFNLFCNLCEDRGESKVYDLSRTRRDMI